MIRCTAVKARAATRWSLASRAYILPARCTHCNRQSNDSTRLARRPPVMRDARAAFLEFRDALTSGKIRAAEKIEWPVANQRLGERRDPAGLPHRRARGERRRARALFRRQGDLSHSPLHALASAFAWFPADRRSAPEPTSHRPWSACRQCSSTSGAYVDEGTMVDSHALVGSCAQVGKRVHISAAAQVGGVLEPINASPVIIEDDVLVGGNCGVYEGTQVGARAVLGAGVILTRSTPLFDTVKGEIYRASEGRAAARSRRRRGGARARVRSPRARPRSGDCRCTRR